MNYIEDNKAAWEEAFKNRKPNWGDNDYLRLKNKKLDFFNDDMKSELEKMDFRGKKIAQFCCNKGGELLSLMELGASEGVGFDIAENIIEHARETAKKADINNCTFVVCNILDIPTDYHNQFDFIFFTIGGIIWFDDLTLLFNKVSKCLKPNGLLLINDFHPFMNMLLFPGDDGFLPDDLNRFTCSYFRREPWVYNDGMDYMSIEYKSKTFTSFFHTMSDIINALSKNGIKTVKLNEYDYDIGITDVYNNKEFPLSYILIAEKC